MGPPHGQRHSWGVWEMGMTMAGRRCQLWSNTMAKGRIVSCRALWRMKNAPVLYLELMDSVSENKEERGTDGPKLKRRTLLECNIIQVTFFPPAFFPSFVGTCHCCSGRTANPQFSERRGRMKVSTPICFKVGGSLPNIVPRYMAP